jgi:hypothetical protein
MLYLALVKLDSPNINLSWPRSPIQQHKNLSVFFYAYHPDIWFYSILTRMSMTLVIRVHLIVIVSFIADLAALLSREVRLPTQ